MQRCYLEHNCDEDGIVGIFSTLHDANNRVHNHCEDNYAPRDDPDADFEEGVDEERCIYYSWKDDTGHGFDAYIRKYEIASARSERARNWGRDIGVPRAEKLDSEGNSEDD